MLYLTVAHLSLLIPVAAPADLPTEDPFTISGRVTQPDGSPAASARVTVESYWPNVPIEPPISIRCDADGAFRGLTSRFGFTTIIHAMSADGSRQSQILVPDFMARTIAVKPLVIKLQPAESMKVTVTAGGKPVPNCEIVMDRLPGTRWQTDRGGNAALRFPIHRTSSKIIAFHPKHGIGAWQQKEELDSLPSTIEIQLARPAPHKFHVLDQRDEPVPNFNIQPAIRWGEVWASANTLPAAHIQTGKDGTANVSWIPANYTSIDAPAVSTRWQVDERSSSGNTTELRVRRKHSFVGLVRFPDGKPRAGVLVVARSFGPRSRGDHTQTRTNEKGVFQLHLAPDHAYVLGVRDQQWASELYGGVLLRTKDDWVEYAKRGTILSAKSATQVTVKVVGLDGKSVSAAWINFGLPQDVEWIDINGQKQRGTNSIHHWVRTDSQGVGSFGTLPGKLQIRATKHGWSHEQEVTIRANEPLAVTIHREP